MYPSRETIRNSLEALVLWVVVTAVAGVAAGADLAAVVALALAPMVAMAFVVSVMYGDEA